MHDDSFETDGTPGAPETTALLPARDTGVEAVRESVADLAAVLPTRIEAAVARALESADGAPLPRQIGELQRAIQTLSRDLHAERLGRIGDVEVLVDLMVAAAEAQDRRVAALETQVTSLVAAVEALTPVVANVAEKLDRRVRISVQTEPGAQPFGNAANS
jgi:hypothetical protein